MKRLALAAMITVTNVYSQDFYFDSDVYHKIDCSEEEACYISSYEKSMVWDTKINMDEIRRTFNLGKIHYVGKYTGKSFEVTIIFHPKRKELNVLGQGENITYRCQLADKKQYICKDLVNDRL